MKIIVGLGNPGKDYQSSRHNVGFMAVDRLAQLLNVSWREEKAFTALIAKTAELILIKPRTYMNDSGRAVQGWLQYYRKIETSATYPQLAVIYDDLDIPFGSWKWQFGTGPKAHNGVKSVIAHLGTDQFWHGRIGTENRENHRLSVPSDEYVLAPFVANEMATLAQVLKEMTDQLLKKW